MNHPSLYSAPSVRSKPPIGLEVKVVILGPRVNAVGRNAVEACAFGCISGREWFGCEEGFEGGDLFEEVMITAEGILPIAFRDGK